MLSKLVKRAARGAGFDLTRHRPDFVDLMRHHAITTVLDVGANEGQYAVELREHGYGGQIVSFEPITQPFEVLARKAAADPQWDAMQLALGESQGEMDIFVSAKSVFSSFKGLSDYSKQNFQGAAAERTERVRIERLDGFLAQQSLDLGRTYLKIDTQGFEKEVLVGAGETLHQIRVVQAELALQPLYEGQESWIETIRWMEAQGFRTVLAKENGIDRARCELLELDVVFLNARYQDAG